MYKKTVTYENFDGETVTEDFFFNLTKGELMELEVSEKEGFSEAMQRIIKAEDGKQIIAGFKTILLMAYGVKDDKGRFYKDSKETAIFAASNAYSEIFMGLATDATAGAEFVNGVIPKELSQGQAPTKQGMLTIDDLSQKMKEKIDSMGIKDVPLPLEGVTPDFASMSTEQFEAWKNSHT